MMSVFMFYTEDAESELICEHHKQYYSESREMSNVMTFPFYFAHSLSIITTEVFCVTVRVKTLDAVVLLYM